MLVVGNPANTNALIAQSHAPDVPAERFTAMTRLDHNRALSQLAARTGSSVRDLARLTIWGNHSATQYPDLFHATVGGRPALELVDTDWVTRHLHPDGRQARCGDHRRPRARPRRPRRRTPRSTTCATGSPGTPAGDWTSAGVVSDGSYGVPEGLISSFPVTSSGGDWEIVQGLELSELSRTRLDASVAELVEERDAVRGLGLV